MAEYSQASAHCLLLSTARDLCPFSQVTVPKLHQCKGLAATPLIQGVVAKCILVIQTYTTAGDCCSPFPVEILKLSIENKVVELYRNHLEC